MQTITNTGKGVFDLRIYTVINIISTKKGYAASRQFQDCSAFDTASFQWDLQCVPQHLIYRLESIENKVSFLNYALNFCTHAPIKIQFSQHKLREINLLNKHFVSISAVLDALERLFIFDWGKTLFNLQYLLMLSVLSLILNLMP